MQKVECCDGHSIFGGDIHTVECDLEEPSHRRWYTVEDLHEKGLDTDEIGELYNKED
jgi:hypothetical protein